ncbi:MAG: hypothetical protein LQ346_003835 [Caloplaca aetnensis]|nr:MAG: hypothetical protein LQ346_003835 [Caloplaca aetnensis]
MACQQPVRAPPHSTPIATEAKDRPTEAIPSHHVAPIDAREWVLFPTPQQHSSSPIRTASTDYTPQTAGLSRLSEFRSFNTAARSSPDNEDEDALEDDELDSLDDGLHAFQERSPGQDATFPYQIGSILPTHDGLGTFPGSSALVHEHLWQFEIANPRRMSLGHNRRRSSVQRRLDALEHDDGLRMERERMDRIERWRLEHSRMLLEEVERASRRSGHQFDIATPTTHVAEMPSTGIHGAISGVTSAPVKKAEAKSQKGDDSPWLRLLHSVMRDLLGIDEAVLALLFGEALPSTHEGDLLTTSTSGKAYPGQSLLLHSNSSPSLNLLTRLSQELAAVLCQFSYVPAVIDSPVDRRALDYAGLPITEAYGQQPPKLSAFHPDRSEPGLESTLNPMFSPTLEGRPQSAGSDFGHAALWGIEEEALDSVSASQDHEYWEQTPSIRTVFRLLRQHFTARHRPLLAANTFSSNKKASNVATTSTADSLRRASVIRQHHPLVSRQHPRRTATVSRQYSSHSIPNLSSPLFRRKDGSCASISSRKSKRGSGSSRHYWDIGGSIGSESVGGIGVW